jgi:predicted Fe-Mo cluster-binding NifX family protein
MKIAVSSQNFRTVTGHAGKARRFFIYQAEAGGEPQEVARLDLPKEQCFHEWHDSGPHPLDVAQVLITESSGPGFVARLAQRGIRVLITPESDPLQAARLFLQDKLPTLPPEAHEHGHEHGHVHGPE